jgi:CRP/FNR family cyclic AMP-dependent transcriptional regulator
MMPLPHTHGTKPLASPEGLIAGAREKLGQLAQALGTKPLRPPEARLAEARAKAGALAPASPETLIAPRREKSYNLVQRSRPSQPDYPLMIRTNFLKKISLFADLTETELQALAKELSRAQFKKGDAIFYEGDPGQMLYIVESGNIRIYLQCEDGQETSVTVCTSGDIFGELAVIDGLPRSASAIAMEDSVVLGLNREQFREYTRRYPQVAFNFLKALSVRVRSSTQQIDRLSTLRVSSRLARKLLELAQAHGVVESDGVRIPISLTQTDLASMIGTTRESINKALASFKKQGLIRVQSGWITVVDPEALRAIHT